MVPPARSTPRRLSPSLGRRLNGWTVPCPRRSRIRYLRVVATEKLSPEQELNSLQAKGYQIEFLSHAKAILFTDFPEAVSELTKVLSELTIPIEEIIAGGGGEAKGTQRLRKALTKLGWPKTEFVIGKTINGKPCESISHEVDHVREFDQGTIALEIEWNNKDPFFDRDLENFKRGWSVVSRRISSRRSGCPPARRSMRSPPIRRSSCCISMTEPC
jgi:hypothetical protein